MPVKDLIKRFVDFEVKAVEGEERTYWFTASTDDRDRMGDVIVQGGWKLQNFRKNPVILWAHRYNDLPVGKAIEAKVEDGRLRLKIQFAPESIYPFAATVEKMVAAKYLRTGSVGFSVYKVEDLNEEDKKTRPEMTWGKRLYGELLEFSIVPVPANPMALGDKAFGEMVARSFGYESTEPQREGKESHFLPYKDANGKVSERLLRASVAALAGARGGVPIPESERDAHYLHLARVADENGIEIPVHQIGDQESLRKSFGDVWHDELLDIVQAGLEEKDREILPLIKGKTREALSAARDALSKILDASEEEPPKQPVEPDKDIETASLITGIVKDLAATTAALK